MLIDRYHNRTRRSGFTLLELLVVMSIVSVIALAFATLLGTIRAGDPITRAAADIRAMIQRGKSEALSRNARFELLVDFEQNQIVPIERSPIVFFGFEGSMNAKAPLLLPADQIESQFTPRRDGKCLRGGGKEVTIPFIEEFNPASPDDGMAFSFDVYPRVENGESFTILSRTGQWDVRFTGGANRTCDVSASFGFARLNSTIPLATYSWGQIEVIVTPFLARLYVNNVPAASTKGVTLKEGANTPIKIGDINGIPFFMDNLRFETVRVDDPYELSEGAWLVPPGATPEDAVKESVYDLPVEDQETQASAPPKDQAEPPLPLDVVSDENEWNARQVPVKQALIFFNEQGHLDLNFHYGPLRLVIAGKTDDGFAYRRFVDISLMGIVTEHDPKDEPIPEDEEQPAAVPDFGGEQ